MKEILILIIVAVALYWFFILRPGKLDFWKIAAKYPDDAYDHFISNTCWKVFENGLSENQRKIVPKDEWTGPFRLLVPKLGNKMVYIFGRYPELERSQKDFLNKFTHRA